jgi:transcriptional regulator NrdR family protein
MTRTIASPQCPECQFENTKVFRTTRSKKGDWHRVRICNSCKTRFATAQPAEVVVLSEEVTWPTGRQIRIDWQAIKARLSKNKKACAQAASKVQSPFT